MTALTVESPRSFFGGERRRISAEINANPFAGSAISIAPDGHAHELVAGEPFAGFCVQTIPTADVATADGSRLMEVIAGTFTAILTVTNAAQDDVAHGRLIYASDDNVFTLTATGNTLIGRVVGLEASGKAIVECNTAGSEPAGVLNGKIYSLSAAETLTTQHLGATIFGDTQSAAFSLTLPPAADCTGRCFTFIRSGTGVNALTIDGNASENVDGATTLATMDAIRDTATIISDGSNWFIIAARLA